MRMREREEVFGGVSGGRLLLFAGLWLVGLEGKGLAVSLRT